MVSAFGPKIRPYPMVVKFPEFRCQGSYCPQNCLVVTMLDVGGNRGVAQSVARHVRDVEVAGSSPVAPTRSADEPCKCARSW